MDFTSWNIFWSLFSGFLATLIVGGNILTIWIFVKQRRRKRAYFLLVSLAVADLLVGLLAVPLFIAAATSSKSTRTVALVFIGVDMFTGVTSIYTLAVISLERMIAIGWPFRHRTLKFRIYICAIVIPWIIAAIPPAILVFKFFNIITQDSFLHLLDLIMVTPLLVMCFAYCVSWKKQKSPMANQNHVAREAKLAKTLFLITGCSLLTWLPFQILNLFSLRKTVNLPNLLVTFYFIKLLQFSNSLVNVIIYPFRIPEFKNALLQILRCCVVPFQRFNAEVSPSVESGPVVSISEV